MAPLPGCYHTDSGSKRQQQCKIAVSKLAALEKIGDMRSFFLMINKQGFSAKRKFTGNSLVEIFLRNICWCSVYLKYAIACYQAADILFPVSKVKAEDIPTRSTLPTVEHWYVNTIGLYCVL